MRARLPWLGLALWAGLTATGMAQAFARGETTDAWVAPTLVVLAGVGALLAVRRPDNAIGWLLLGVALMISFSQVLQGLYDEHRAPPGDLPRRSLVWLDNWDFYVWVTLIGVELPLRFPDGRLPSRRLQRFERVALVAIGLAIAGVAFGDRTLQWGTNDTVPNPFRAPGLLGDALGALSHIGGGLFTFACAGALVGLATRWRGSRGVERLQFKWFTLAMSVLIAGLIGSAVGEIAKPIAVVGDIGWSVFLLALVVGLPLAIGVAVMRYRLYDIDVVINRALVYGALTVTLGVAYLALVLLTGLTVGRSGFAVAASTLAVAALFRPARARIQAAVDQRFYRRRYDAARTLEAFGARLRDELDLEALGDDLRGVVRETVQPAHVSLWLRSTR